jgi:8-hydroxy-5-deazaflavin:NADPH oxidoreductase
LGGAVPSGTSVVKAFDTTFANRLQRTPGIGHPLDVFVAGDDDAAKQQLAALVDSTGLHLVDAGPLRRARELEALGFLHVTLQGRLGTGFEAAIALAR